MLPVIERRSFYLIQAAHKVEVRGSARPDLVRESQGDTPQTSQQNKGSIARRRGGNAASKESASMGIALN